MAHYLNNADFTRLVNSYNSDRGNHQEDFARALLLLADNIVSSFRFFGVEKADAMQECVLMCLSKAGNYNPERGRCFNFFTTICLNHCRHLYKKSKRYTDLKNRYFDSQKKKPRP